MKMESDKLLLQLKNDIIEATEGLKKGNNDYIAGAIVIKYLNRITILCSGYNKDLKIYIQTIIYIINYLKFIKMNMII